MRSVPDSPLLFFNATGKNKTGGSGDITLSGSALKAGGGMTLDAARDINLLSAQNTERTEGRNLSHGINLTPARKSIRTSPAYSPTAPSPPTSRCCGSRAVRCWGNKMNLQR
ncbi:hemagglutinin repeat-containing protein [Erwinia sp. S43]|uniref:hemagglutinin repeat-containing protein n=1 Tax=Erwinia sp. S43 TaxID=2769339 RepID=UPI00190B04C4|nr:hemagglutinin repeat-containing protein [Erwinia sp. S43]